MDDVIPGFTFSWSVAAQFLASAVAPFVIDWLKTKWSLLREHDWQRQATFIIVLLSAAVIEISSQLLTVGSVHFTAATFQVIATCALISIGVKNFIATKKVPPAPSA